MRLSVRTMNCVTSGYMAKDPLTRPEEIKRLRLEIEELNKNARKCEDWLENNISSENFEQVRENYTLTLYSLCQKREKLSTLLSGRIDSPETYQLPRKQQHTPK